MYSSSIGEKAKLHRLLGIITHQSLKYSLPPTLVSELLSSYALYLRISLQYSLTLYPMQHISKRAKIADSSPYHSLAAIRSEVEGPTPKLWANPFSPAIGPGVTIHSVSLHTTLSFPHQFCCTTPLCTISANTLLAFASCVLIAPLK